MIWIIFATLGVLLAIAVMIYMLPEDSARSRKKKEKKEQAHLSPDLAKSTPEKDWKAIAERWERNNNALLGDVEKLKMQEKKLLKDFDQLKAQNKEMADKLALEKSWREKEQVNLEKLRHHDQDLKEQVIRTEKDLEKEHSNRLRLERDHQDIKVKYEALLEEKRAATTKAMSLETTVKQLTQEVKDLRRDNEELKKKREDIQWVAKSEFDELQKRYNELKGP